MGIPCNIFQFLCKCENASKQKVTPQKRNKESDHHQLFFIKNVKNKPIICKFYVCSGKSSFMILHNHLHYKNTDFCVSISTKGLLGLLVMVKRRNYSCLFSLYLPEWLAGLCSHAFFSMCELLILTKSLL